jgi:hypothetical protein
LNDDTLDEGYVGYNRRSKKIRCAKSKQILSISIYVASDVKRKVPLGQRVDLYYGSAPDLKQILEEERAGTYINRVQEETGMRGDMAVLGKNRLSLSAKFTLLTVGSFSDWLDPR